MTKQFNLAAGKVGLLYRGGWDEDKNFALDVEVDGKPTKVSLVKVTHGKILGRAGNFEQEDIMTVKDSEGTVYNGSVVCLGENKNDMHVSGHTYFIELRSRKPRKN